MRTGNELERLTAAEPELLGQEADYLVDASEREQILDRILATDRPRAARRGAMTRHRRVALVLVGVALAAAVASVVTLGHGRRPASLSHGGPHRFALSGATIQLAGYHFRTPAGFKRSATACAAAPADAGNGFSAAASADGGCVEAFYVISSTGSAVPPGATAVSVGAYQGYLVSRDGQDASSLYVVLPGLGKYWQAALLDAKGLTADQLVAVAKSGLPASP
jgi:hypothetical protein